MWFSSFTCSNLIFHTEAVEAAVEAAIFYVEADIKGFQVGTSNYKKINLTQIKCGLTNYRTKLYFDFKCSLLLK